MEDWGLVSKFAQIQLVHTTVAVCWVIQCLPMVQVAMVINQTTWIQYLRTLNATVMHGNVIVFIREPS